MLIQVPQADNTTIETTQKLLDALPVNHPKRRQIEQDLQRMISGRSGEKTVAYQLEFWFRDAEDVVIANNLRLEFNGRSAQIDHIVAVPAGIMVMESKALPAEVHVDEEGNWYRVHRSADAAPQREGMFNPVEQNRRHIAVVEEILQSSNLPFVPKVANVVVLPNPKMVLTGTKPSGVSIVRADRLQGFIERTRAIAPQGEGASPRHWIEALLPYHSPVSVDVFARYHIDPRELRPLDERIVVDPKTEEFACAFCGAAMIIRKTKNGLVWSCGKYPACKNIVPASVAAKVAQKFVDEYNRTHFWTSRAKRCPNCGGKMQDRRTRYGRVRECVNTALCRYKEDR
jgi:predicted RNA-binding Zn-ribbon protein involved in translation (DUF1610 family)